MKLVEIIWKDIVSDNGWHTPNKIDSFVTNTDQTLVKQVGYLYEEDENQIVLLDSYFKNKELFGGIHIIPKGCIQETIELKSKLTEW